MNSAIRILKISALFLLVICNGQVIADTTWTSYTSSNSQLPSNNVSSIDFDSDGNQYIGTSGGGLVIRHGLQWDIYNATNTGIPVNAVRSVERDENSNLWVAASTGDLDISPQGFGVGLLDASDSSWSMQNHGLEISGIITGIIDDGTYRYVSTYGGGITIYSDSGWVRYRVASRTEFTYADSQLQIFDVPAGTYIPSNYIRAMDYDLPTNGLWLGTADGGLVSKSGTAWTKYTSANSGLPSNQILSVKCDKLSGKVFIGTAGYGLAIFDLSNWVIYDSDNSPMENEFITAIDISAYSKEIWLGTRYDVLVLDTTGAWRIYPPDVNNLLGGDFYSDISFDMAGNVWVASYNGGMSSLKIDSVSPPPPPPPPPPDTLCYSFTNFDVSFFKNRSTGHLRAELDVNQAPRLASGDTIFFNLESSYGNVYRIELPFKDFWGPGNPDSEKYHYKYKKDKLQVTLRIDEFDFTHLEIKISDLDADIDRDNFDHTLLSTLRIGEVIGTCVIMAVDDKYSDISNLYSDDNTNLDENLGSGSLGILSSDGMESYLPNEIEMTNYPNPFNGYTNISLTLPTDTYLEIRVYDILGRQISDVYSGRLDGGQYSFRWPLAGEASLLKSGVYYYNVRAADVNLAWKMLYLK